MSRVAGTLFCRLATSPLSRRLPSTLEANQEAAKGHRSAEDRLPIPASRQDAGTCPHRNQACLPPDGQRLLSLAVADGDGVACDRRSLVSPRAVRFTDRHSTSSTLTVSYTGVV